MLSQVDGIALYKEPMMQRYVWQLSIWFVVVMAATACSGSVGVGQTAEIEVTQVAVTIVTPDPTPTTAVCTALPDDMTADIVLATDTAVLFELTGLQPGETLTLLVTGESEDMMSRSEIQLAQPIGADGRFQETIRLDPDTSITEWEIKVIHARGVACLEVNERR
jgi:hypothetical protein